MLYPATFTSRVISPALEEDSLESAAALNNRYVIGSTAGIEKALSDIPTLKGKSACLVCRAGRAHGSRSPKT